MKDRFAKTMSSGDHHRFKDHAQEARIFTLRAAFSAVVVLLAFGGLLARFYWLQVVHHDDYATLSDQNRIQVRAIAPNRGLIYDARGVLLAENRPSMTLSIIKERAGSLTERIAELEKLIPISERDKERFYRALSLRRRPFEAVPLRYRLSEEELAKIAVNEYALKGVIIEGRLVRHYPLEGLFAHSVGYVGRINAVELSRFSKDDERRYGGTQSIGKIGLERYYESQLLGFPGRESIETNARGRVLRVLDAEPPIAGHDLKLFLRADLQQVAEKALAGKRGAVVALDVKTGGVLTLLSNPGYDPNLFVTGISAKEYRALNSSKQLPLFNRAIQGQYPPGSTIKPVLGLGGLETGVITADHTIRDPGFYQLENDERLYREWKKGGHGSAVNLHEAIVESCDIYFYDLGYRMGVDKIHQFGLFFGFGQKTDIDIPSERAGLWPSRPWKKRVRGLNWYPGNTLNMSIGQGDVLATPLQLAAMTATIAHRGEYIEPRLVAAVGDVETVPIVRSQLEASEEHWQHIIKDMVDVVHSWHGTAHSVGRKMHIKMAGKTGTAQVVSIAQNAEYDSKALAERNRDHALFVGFAPADDPQIAIAVVIENGEKSSKAALVAKKVAEYYLLTSPPLKRNSSTKKAAAKGKKP